MESLDQYGENVKGVRHDYPTLSCLQQPFFICLSSSRSVNRIRSPEIIDHRLTRRSSKVWGVCLNCPMQPCTLISPVIERANSIQATDPTNLHIRSDPPDPRVSAGYVTDARYFRNLGRFVILFPPRQGRRVSSSARVSAPRIGKDAIVKGL